jgi:phage terminase large subunit
MTTAEISLPPILVNVFSPPRGEARYRCMYGGRGSGKSQTAAIMAAVWGYAEPLKILCCREFQESIRSSFHAELKAAIEAHPWLSAHYDVGIDYLRGANGTEFIFRGLRRNEQSIKSLAKIDLTIVEEAEDIPESSWLALEATVFRQPKSEIWTIWNPKREDSPVDRRFRKHTPPGTLITEINWRDNPFFPKALEDLRAQQEITLDPTVYRHVWEGDYLRGFVGAYYAEALEKARLDDRISFFPRQGMQKVHAVWDIGSTSSSADATAIWIVQYIGEEVRWLDYYEAVGQPFESHVKWLRSAGWEDAVCVLPHDGRKHDNVFATTPEKFLREAGFPVEVVPNQGKGAAMERIYALRAIMPQCRWNADSTEIGRTTLSYYHEKRDEVRNIGLGPEHDFSSHCCLVAGSMVRTTKGEIPIEKISSGDLVLTPAGPASVSWSGQTKVSTELVRIVLQSGAELTMTPEHKVFTTSGVVRADAVGCGDFIITGMDQEGLKLENASNVGYREAFSESFGTKETFAALKIAESVVKVERFGQSVPVYDLTVDHHHCYYANGMLVSNSDAAGLVAIYRERIKNSFADKSGPIRRNLKGIA